jgi:uncharacterized protein YggE
MKRWVCLSAILIAAAGLVSAQTSAQQHRVRASGSATVSVKPDQLRLSVGVVTQAATAQESADQNAAQMAKVLSGLKQVLGSTGEIETVSYSVSPVYRYGTGGASTLIGYSTSNLVEAKTGDLSLGSRLIDAATGAGANAVQGLRFTLKDSEPVRGEALRLATRQARTNAGSIASGLGRQIGEVVLAEESSAVSPVVDGRIAAAEGTATPLEAGLVEVSARVVVEAELN